MKKQLLSEVNRVREIMGIKEQYSKAIKTGEETTNVTVNVPPIKGNYGTGKSDPTNFIEGAIITIINEINNTQDAAKYLEDGKLQLVDINVVAGASNNWGTPTQFDHEIVGGEYLPSNEGRGEELDLDGYNSNLELAKLRASRFIEEVTPLLESQGIDISEQLSSTPVGMVVDTGGKVDDDSCTTDCGQVLLLTLSFKYVDFQEFFTNKCQPGIEITIGSQGQVEGHVCDEAVFKVLVNGHEIGIANLNNAGYDLLQGGGAYPWLDRGHMNSVTALQNIDADKRYSDGIAGGERSWTTMIDTTNPELNWGEENKLSIKSIVETKNGMSFVKGGLVCVDDTARAPALGSGRNQRCGGHTEVPYVIIKNTPIEGQLTEVYNDYPNVDVPRGSMKVTELLDLNNCGVPISGVETVQK